MAMVCLGACVFTIDSMFAFVDGTMGWDASHGRMGKAPSCRWRRLLPWPAREASASGPGCSTHSGRAPRLLRPQWQQMVLPSACAKAAHSAPFIPQACERRHPFGWVRTVRRPPGRCPSSTPAPSHVAPGGSGRPGLPKGRCQPPLGRPAATSGARASPLRSPPTPPPSARAGVGFLGAASIWKGTRPKLGENGVQVPEVHGLTTATSVWLSAAIGLLCGGGLYVPALFATASSVVYLRFAPRLNGSAS